MLSFFGKIDDIINTQLPEFQAYKEEIKKYLGIYFNMDLD
jgi:hypothetical protein